MAKAAALLRLARQKVKGFAKTSVGSPKQPLIKDKVRAAKNLSLIATGGAIAGSQAGPPGLRKAGAVEGALGATVLAGAATIGTKIVFRRIRGRIIPIRVKAN